MIKIGLDLDGVLADVINVWIDKANKKRLEQLSPSFLSESDQTLAYGSKATQNHHYNNNSNNKLTITREDVNSWDFWERFGIDRFDFYRELSECWKLWQSIPSTEPDISHSTKLLSDIGQVDIVTARDNWTHNYAKKWLKHHNVNYNGFVTVLEGSYKATLNYDVFIDDSPVNARRMLENKKHVVVYDQPWNKELQHPAPRLFRVSNLYQAVDLISGIFANNNYKKAD